MSANVIPVEPTSAGITAGLLVAAEHVEDTPRRMTGAATRWSTDWDEALGGEVMRKLWTFLPLPGPISLP